jgi:hypothetical protein
MLGARLPASPLDVFVELMIFPPCMAQLKTSLLKSINASDLNQLAQPYTDVKALKTLQTLPTCHREVREPIN